MDITYPLADQDRRVKKKKLDPKSHAQQHVLTKVSIEQPKTFTNSTHHEPTHLLFLTQPQTRILFRHLIFVYFNTRQTACHPVAKCPCMLTRPMTINICNLGPGFHHQEPVQYPSTPY